MPKGWKEYLVEMDHSKGTTNVMIQKAMKLEITQLKKQLRKQTLTIERNKEAAKKWRAVATRYQTMAGNYYSLTQKGTYEHLRSS